MIKNLEVLLHAASDKDAVLTKHLLADFGISCRIFSSVEELNLNISESTGAIVLAKEVLDAAKISLLVNRLNKQPPWSSLPVILLVSAGDLSSSIALDLVTPIPNVTLLERPVRQRALTSLIQSAIADRKRQLELRDSLNDAIEANRAKSEFLANMSHEIRTPLGAILGFSELLAEPGLGDLDRKNYLDTIQRNGQLLTAIINDILDLAKVEAGRLQIELCEVSIIEILSEVVSALEPKAKLKNVKLLLELSPELPELIFTDPLRLKQILLNIVGNALKFTEKGKVSIAVSMEGVKGDAKTKNEILFAITDTGIGIKPEQASLLFQSFSQADSSITRKFGGTGLGLVLSQRLARALGGNLRLVESKFGAGSTFEISISTEVATNQKKVTGKNEEQLLDPIRLDKVHILVVEDSKDNQFLLTRILASTGAKVSVADNGEVGIQLALDQQPDVILMDVQMPVLSGIDATIRLRTMGFRKAIVALTAHALKGDREHCLDAGCSAYLTKPVHRSELISTIRHVLSVQHKGRHCQIHRMDLSP